MFNTEFFALRNVAIISIVVIGWCIAFKEFQDKHIENQE